MLSEKLADNSEQKAESDDEDRAGEGAPLEDARQDVHTHVVHHIAEDDNIPVTPSSSTGPDLDVISYVPHLDTYFSPGRLFPIGVQISKNLCSQCGVSRPTKWCSHLRNSALKAGIPIRSLTQLRRNQRADKSKSGWKAPS